MIGVKIFNKEVSKRWNEKIFFSGVEVEFRGGGCLGISFLRLCLGFETKISGSRSLKYLTFNQNGDKKKNAAAQDTAKNEKKESRGEEKPEKPEETSPNFVSQTHSSSNLNSTLNNSNNTTTKKNNQPDFNQEKKRKTLLTEATKKFNQHPKKGHTTQQSMFLFFFFVGIVI